MFRKTLRTNYIADGKRFFIPNTKLSKYAITLNTFNANYSFYVPFLGMNFSTTKKINALTFCAFLEKEKNRILDKHKTCVQGKHSSIFNNLFCWM